VCVEEWFCIKEAHRRNGIPTALLPGFLYIL